MFAASVDDSWSPVNEHDRYDRIVEERVHVALDRRSRKRRIGDKVDETRYLATIFLSGTHQQDGKAIK